MLEMPDGEFVFKLLFIGSYTDPDVVNPCLDYGSVVNVLWIHDVLRDLLLSNYQRYGTDVTSTMNVVLVLIESQKQNVRTLRRSWHLLT
jgi:hypothetical protein